MSQSSNKLEFKTDQLNAPRPYGPYSHAVIAGDFVLLAGQSGRDVVSGKVIDGDIKAQTAQAIRVVDNILRGMKLTLRDVVRVTAFLTNMEQFSEFNEVYESSFSPPYPVRSTVEVSKLPFGAVVAIEATAFRGQR